MSDDWRIRRTFKCNKKDSLKLAIASICLVRVAIAPATQTGVVCVRVFVASFAW